MTVSEYEHYPKAERIEKELQAEIAAGKHGIPGTPFMTTRYLMDYKNISLKTAHRILGRLCTQGLLEVQGKRYYLKKAESRKSGKLKIGLLLTRLDTPYFSNLAANLEEMTRDFGAELSIAVSDYDAALERKRLKMLCEEGVSGIFACPWGIEENSDAYEKLPVPCVLIGRTLKNGKADAVLINNTKAARLTAKHLLDEGCKRFLYLGPKKLNEDQRLQGFRLGVLEGGFTLPEKNIITVNDADSDLSELRMLLLKTNLKTGVFCYHDLFAARVINLCHEEKLEIPNQIAVAGFDNLPVAAAIYPPLTSVAYPLRNMARMACEVLFTRMKRPETVSEGISRYLDSELIIRQSTSLDFENKKG